MTPTQLSNACVHQGEPFPNLGELRSLSWSVEELNVDEGTVRLSAYGPISAIKASKTISLAGQTVQMSFEIESLSPLPSP
jgi:hypothetical protein